MTGTVVIVGAGQAGAQVAASLREHGHAGRIVIIGDEPHLPYQRPPLSKAHLKSDLAAARLELWPADFYVNRDIELITGTAALRLDPRHCNVALASGSDIAFDKLVIATGTRARTPPIPGIDLDGVASLRSIADVARLRPRLDAMRRAVIIGGGYIGLEVAAVLREAGKDVTIVEAEERLLKRVCADVTGRFFEALHRENGVTVLTSAKVAAISGETRASGVVLGDGRVIGADLVLLAVGAVANAELAAEAGLAVGDGILVDALGRTSVDGVYSCGDCTRFPSRRFGKAVRLESVQNAIEQAKAVAATIAGKPTPHDPIPWFWSDQYSAKLQIAGLSDSSDTVTSEGATGGSLIVEYRRRGRLVAVDAVNNARAHMLARRRIAEATGPQMDTATTNDR
ncbi:MAG: FAD-dependent oxidoreductase, partial [Proteobacteria bacterium]|nr:FAD-dependent oxidoreductase [Pseudomonadota bacterium]